MKKFYSFLFAAAALAGFAACNSDLIEESVPAQKENVGKMEFTANIGEETKTQLDGMSVKWSKGDAIWVNGGNFEIKDKESYTPATTATFTGDAVVGAPYMAVYPYSAYMEEDSDSTCIVNLNANIDLGTSFRNDANISVAYSENGTDLSFKNVLSVLKFQVAAECDEITISSTAALVGEFVVDCKTAEIINLGGKDNFRLSGDFEPGNDYYMTVLPGTHELTITINGSLSTTKASKTIVRNKIYDLGVLPVEVPVYRVYVTPQPGTAYAEWEKVNLYTWVKDGIELGWPGQDITNNTEVINGYTYNYFEYPAEYLGKTVNVIVNNGTTQTEDILLGELDKDYYVVYSPIINTQVSTTAPAAGSIEEYVAPENLDPKPDTTTLYLKTTWGWSDWALYAWGGNGDWGAFYKWPGKAKEYDQVIEGVTYKAWDIPESCVGLTGVQVIVTGQENGEKQTHDTPVTFEAGKDVFVEITGWDGTAGKATMAVIDGPY